MRALLILMLVGFFVGITNVFVSIHEGNITKAEFSILLTLLYFIGGLFTATKLEKI